MYESHKRAKLIYDIRSQDRERMEREMIGKKDKEDIRGAGNVLLLDLSDGQMDMVILLQFINF